MGKGTSFIIIVALSANLFSPFGEMTFTGELNTFLEAQGYAFQDCFRMTSWALNLAGSFIPTGVPRRAVNGRREKPAKNIPVHRNAQKNDVCFLPSLGGDFFNTLRILETDTAFRGLLRLPGKDMLIRSGVWPPGSAWLFLFLMLLFLIAAHACPRGDPDAVRLIFAAAGNIPFIRSDKGFFSL